MRHLGLLVLCLIAGLGVACSGIVQARTPAFVLGEPTLLRYETGRTDNIELVINIWERAYKVPGATAAEVGDNLDALRQSTGHGPYSASTKWDLKVSLRYANESGSCKIAAATVEVVAVVTMPALADGSAMDSASRERWSAFIDNLRAHELEHVENEIAAAEAYRTDLLAMPPLASCREVGDLANALQVQHEQAILAADIRLDAQTKHGALTGATFP